MTVNPILLLEGFDDYATANNGTRAGMLSSGYSAAGAQCVSRTNTPHGMGQSLRVPNSYGDSDPSCAYAYGGTIADLITGFHFNFVNGIVFSGAALPILGFCREDYLGNYGYTLWLIRNAQSGLTLARSDNNGNGYNVAALAYSDANLVFPDTWYFVELRFNFLSSTFEVWLDEDLVISASTGGFPISAINMFRTTGPSGNVNPELLLDNMYALNGQGASAPFNAPLGEIIVFTSNPDGDADPNEMTMHGTTETDHYQLVDDAAIDDSNYLTTETEDEEYFTIQNLPADTIELLAAGIAARLRKDAGSPARFRMKARIGASETVGGNKTISATFQTKYEWLAEKPGGGAWEISDGNSLEVGVETVAS